MNKSYQTNFQSNDGVDNLHSPMVDLESSIKTICAEEFSLKLNRPRKCGCNPYSSLVRAGPFVLGSPIEFAPFCENIDQYLGRKIDDPNPNRYYFLKITNLSKEKQNEIPLHHQPKMTIYNEYSVLSLLKDEPGVIQVEGLYMDYFYQDKLENPENKEIQCERPIPKCEKCLKYINSNKTFMEVNNFETNRPKCPDDLDHHYLDCEYLNQKGDFIKRLILSFDCPVAHKFCSTISLYSQCPAVKFSRVHYEYENLQEYVRRLKSIPERKALKILAEIVDIIYRLHQKQIAHRDLRLENILYDHYNNKVLLINFGLARYVINDTTLISDHRGSAAYISPDVLKRRPYPPKASDCWTLGIILYTMLYGKFPFYGESYNELFKKIGAGLYKISTNQFSQDAINLIRFLIVTDADKRINIVDLRQKLHKILEKRNKEKMKLKLTKLIERNRCIDDQLQVVPDMDQPIHQNALLKHNFRLLFEKGFDFDHNKWDPSKFHWNKAMLETLKKLALEQSKNKNNLKINSSSTILTNIFEAIDKKNNVDMDMEHLHDHDYTQKKFQNSISHLDQIPTSNSNAFNDYLNSSKFLSSPNKLPVPYFTLRNRFCSDDRTSIYKYNRYVNRNSLLMDEIYKQHCLDSNHGQSSNELEINNDLEMSEDNETIPRKKSKFTVLKVECDVRPLNNHEKRLVHQKIFGRQFSNHFSGSNSN